MSQAKQQSTEYSAWNPFTIIGGLASDIVEAATSAGSEVLDIPNAIKQGWENGAIIDTDKFKASKAYQEMEAEIIKKHEESKSKEQTEPALKTTPNQLV